MARGRWIVIPLFVALLVGAVMLAGRIGDVTTDEQTLPGSEAARGIELVQTRFSDGREATDIQPVFRNPSLTVDDPAYRAEVTAARKRGAGVVPGTRVVSYFTTGSRDLVGQDGHMTFATLWLPSSRRRTTSTPSATPSARPTASRPRWLAATRRCGTPHLEPQLNDDLARAEMIVLPFALLVLLIFFGSAVSALLPVLLAGVAIVFAFAGTYAAGQAMDIADLVTNVITLVGIAIGIDYALLVVSRFREEMRNGAGRVDATGRTMATAGRAVLLSGVTVAIGLAVLVALPVPFIRSMGIGGMLVPVWPCSLTALTALPAVLAVLGPRVDALRVYPRRWRLREAALWGPIARAVTGWAIPLAAVALVALVALAGQATNMSIDRDELADAPNVESVHAGRLVRAELGGTLNPDIYVIDTGRPDGAYDRATIAALGRVADGFRAQPDIVSGVTWPSATDPEAFRAAAEGGLVDRTGAVRPDAQVAPRGDPLSDSARELNDLMEHRKAEVSAAVPDGTVLLTGEPAVQNEFNEAMYGPFPWLVVGVLVLTFVALMRAFRSWLVPLIAVLASGLSLLATYGLLYLVFQQGIGSGLLGLDGEVRGIAVWVPVMLFAFLFGISMDYQVFLVERMREARRDGGERNRRAVRVGLASTGRIVATAALIMVVAFGGFAAAGQDVSLKEFGFGLAAAVAIDALLVRCLIVPAIMRVAGERNWTMPPRLARIARVRPRPALPARTIEDPR